MALPISKCQPTAGLLNSSTKRAARSEEHTSELQSQSNLVCRLLLEKKKKNNDHFARTLSTNPTVTPTFACLSPLYTFANAGTDAPLHIPSDSGPRDPADGTARAIYH